MTDEVLAACLRCLDTLNNCVWVDVVRTRRKNVIDILRGLCDVTLDVHRETGSLGDGETEVESDDTGNATETNEETPTEIDGGQRGVGGLVIGDGALVGGDDDDTDNSSGYTGNMWAVNYMKSKAEYWGVNIF